MDFTREPIIETVITPKEGFKLVVRSSKGVGQEEYFVDAVEVVTFGHSLFFRSSERPKSFLVPVNDYEVLEVREARMILKNVGVDRSIKIGGGREAPIRREGAVEKVESESSHEEPAEVEGSGETKTDLKGGDKKKDKRTRHRRRRGGRDDRDEEGTKEGANPASSEGSPEKTESQESRRTGDYSAEGSNGVPVINSIIPPPPTLISETIARYKDNALFKGAFYTKEELAARESGGSSVENEPQQESTVLKDEGGYPSLDAIDEVIGHPVIIESLIPDLPSEEILDMPTEESIPEKDDLWSFTEDVKEDVKEEIKDTNGE